MGARSNKTPLQSLILQEGKISYILPFSLSLLWKFATGEKHRSGAATFLSDFWSWWVGDLSTSSIFLFYISPNSAKPICVSSPTHLLHKVGYKKTLPWFVFFGYYQKKKRRKKLKIFVWFVGIQTKLPKNWKILHSFTITKLKTRASIITIVYSFFNFLMSHPKWWETMRGFS